MMTLRYRDDVMENVWNNFFNTGSHDNFSPIYDVVENEKEYSLTFELPGIEDDDVNIQIKDKLLNLEVKEKQLKDSENRDDETFLVKNRRSKSFSKDFKLPNDADTDSVSANLKNGLLVVSINKKEEAKPKRIAITS